MFPRLRSFLATLILRDRFEDSLDEEVRFHLEAQTQDLVRAGVPPEKAARCARVQFGSIEAVKDDCRRVRGLRVIDELQQGMASIIRLALRLILKTPVVTSVGLRAQPSGVSAMRVRSTRGNPNSPGRASRRCPPGSFLSRTNVWSACGKSS